jgi:hypothetical protein
LLYTACVHEPITSIEQVTPERLTAVLRRAGALAQGAVAEVRVTLSRTLVASHVCRLAVAYTVDAPQSAPTQLFLKLSLPELQARFSRKEIEFYTQVAPLAPELPLLRCYDAAFDETTGSAHLLLEDVTETHTQPPVPLPPTEAECEAVIDCVAALHARWWNEPRLGRDIGALTTEAEFAELQTLIARHFAGFCDFLGDRLPAARRARYERVLAGSMHPWRRMLTRAGLTLTHGDAHWWNFLYPREAGQGRVLVFDWHLWHVDAPLKDLAYLIAFNWFPERRARLEEPLLRHYHAHLRAHGVADYKWADCWTDYRHQVIRELFVPVWQWSSGLQPTHWWANLEKIWLAFDDLACAELLD